MTSKLKFRSSPQIAEQLIDVQIEISFINLKYQFLRHTLNAPTSYIILSDGTTHQPNSPTTVHAPPHAVWSPLVFSAIA